MGRTIGLLLPCNVVVRRAPDASETTVEAIDPQTMVQLAGTAAIRAARLPDSLAEPLASGSPPPPLYSNHMPRKANDAKKAAAVEGVRWYFAEDRAGAGYVRAASSGVVLGQRLEGEPAGATRKL